MANSLRNKIKHLCYKGELNERERDRILNALDDADRINSELKPCKDCVSREEAIDIIYDYEYKKDMRKALMELPSVTPKTRWIPVSERLPEEDGEYLVCYEEEYRKDYDFAEVGIAPFEVDCEGFGYWQPHYDKSTLGYLDSDWTEISVIAWMPLPESYSPSGEKWR